MPLMHAQAVIFTMHYFYVQKNNTVTSLSDNFAITQEVWNIGVWDQFEGIFNLEKFQ